MPALPGYYTATEASHALGYKDTSYISAMCRNGEIPAYKVGTIWLIPAIWVEEKQKETPKGQGNRGIARK